MINKSLRLRLKVLYFCFTLQAVMQCLKVSFEVSTELRITTLYCDIPKTTKSQNKIKKSEYADYYVFVASSLSHDGTGKVETHSSVAETLLLPT
jgi:hypothetical protein